MNTHSTDSLAFWCSEKRCTQGTRHIGALKAPRNQMANPEVDTSSSTDDTHMVLTPIKTVPVRAPITPYRRAPSALLPLPVSLAFTVVVATGVGASVVVAGVGVAPTTANIKRAINFAMVMEGNVPQLVTIANYCE